MRSSNREGMRCGKEGGGLVLATVLPLFQGQTASAEERVCGHWPIHKTIIMLPAGELHAPRSGLWAAIATCGGMGAPHACPCPHPSMPPQEEGEEAGEEPEGYQVDGDGNGEQQFEGQEGEEEGGGGHGTLRRRRTEDDQDSLLAGLAEAEGGDDGPSYQASAPGHHQRIQHVRQPHPPGVSGRGMPQERGAQYGGRGGDARGRGPGRGYGAVGTRFDGHGRQMMPGVRGRGVFWLLLRML